MKSTKTLLFAAILTVLSTGCVKHTITADRTLKVGNIYCSDGSILDPNTYKLENHDDASGIIFWVNDGDSIEEKAYIVSLRESYEKLSWCDTLIASGVTTSITAFDGAANTAALQTFIIKRECNAPAMEEAVAYNDGIESWFLPSVGQLMELFNQRELVKQALKACNGQDFDAVWYWTSTEDNSGPENLNYNAYIVSLKEGRIQATNKTLKYKVRPVKAIR